MSPYTKEWLEGLSVLAMLIFLFAASFITGLASGETREKRRFKQLLIEGQGPALIEQANAEKRAKDLEKQIEGR
jgi:hypothetical protein